MKLGVLSDTHNNMANLEQALEILHREGVDVLIHCGDLTTPETACRLQGFRVHHVIGNGDYASGEILHALQSLDPHNTSSLTFSTELDGVRIAAAHGHIPGQVEALVRSGEYAYVFRGHSHRRRDERDWPTRVINPGALGGLRAGPRSCAVLDLHTGALDFFEINQ